MSNYPPGSDTPDAPWNDTTKVMDCEECNGTGEINEDGDNHSCTCCNGTGEIEVLSE
jgi:DnaJ-class molecular chaperone